MPNSTLVITVHQESPAEQLEQRWMTMVNFITSAHGQTAGRFGGSGDGGTMVITEDGLMGASDEASARMITENEAMTIYKEMLAIFKKHHLPVASLQD